MPYFPKERDNSITLTLKSGDTVTLIEKNLSVGDRKAMFKRFLSLQYDFKFRTKMGEDIDKRMDAAGLDRVEFDKVATEGVELLEGVNESLIELYATVIALRFESWDVFATKEAFEQSRPVEMSRDAILLFAESDPRNFALLDDIITQLRGHDEGTQKKEQAVHVNGGSISTVKAVS